MKMRYFFGIVIVCSSFFIAGWQVRGNVNDARLRAVLLENADSLERVSKEMEREHYPGWFMASIFRVHANTLREAARN